MFLRGEGRYPTTRGATIVLYDNHAGGALFCRAVLSRGTVVARQGCFDSHDRCGCYALGLFSVWEVIFAKNIETTLFASDTRGQPFYAHAAYSYTSQVVPVTRPGPAPPRPARPTPPHPLFHVSLWVLCVMRRCVRMREWGKIEVAWGDFGYSNAC